MRYFGERQFVPLAVFGKFERSVVILAPCTDLATLEREIKFAVIFNPR